MPRDCSSVGGRHPGYDVVMKGATTLIATPEGVLFRHISDTTDLAMSGSGDVLAGIIGGLLARGVDALHASLWGVFLHARAGEAFGRSMGSIRLSCHRASQTTNQSDA